MARRAKLKVAEFAPTGAALPQPGQLELPPENLGDLIVRAATKHRAYDIDPLFEVVTQEALFLKKIVETATRKNLDELDVPALAKVADQMSRSIDTIIRTMEFAQGRADSRPELVMQQAAMELLTDTELASIEAMYVKATTRGTRDITPGGE